jgi:hypothetical protein
MRKLLLITVIGLFCVSCGVKDAPEYKSQIINNQKIYLI